MDLDLPSGTKWAKCNIGAYSPEESGDFFAWGETEPKEEYSDSTYSIERWGHYYRDGITELELEDDAARVNLGEFWRIPSVKQFEELMKYCKWQWIEEKKMTKIIGRNGNSIYIDLRGDDINEREVKGWFDRWWYWTRDRSIDPYVFDGISSMQFLPLSHYHGCRIRPVYEDPKAQGGIHKILRFFKK